VLLRVLPMAVLAHFSPPSMLFLKARFRLRLPLALVSVCSRDRGPRIPPPMSGPTTILSSVAGMEFIDEKANLQAR
jgi:hypothetical protein